MFRKVLRIVYRILKDKGIPVMGKKYPLELGFVAEAGGGGILAGPRLAILCNQRIPQEIP